MRDFDYKNAPAKLLTPEIVQMIGSIHEHKGKQELFLEANRDELKTLLEGALIQSTGASNRIEGNFTSDKRLEELVRQKAEPHNRSEQEIAGYREVLAEIHESYNEFENRVEHLKYRTLSKPERIKAMIDQKVGKFSKKELMELCPDISKVTMERTLTELVKAGYIEKVGAGPSTSYVRK